METTKAPLLAVENLHIHIRAAKGEQELTAVEDVSFILEEGGTLGIVGESGCGKSITCLALTRLATDAVFIAKGAARFGGQSLRELDDKAFHTLRQGGFSMIFQDSISGLNPLLKVGKQVAEALEPLGLSREETGRRVAELFEKVGLDSDKSAMNKYPHQMSGGQRQRVMIAMALAMEPKLLIADEPTTALDVTTQLQILALLRQLQRETGMGMILISHDVGVIREMCQNVLVMYSGQVVEAGNTQEVFTSPQHPYTAGLIRSVSVAGHKGQLLHAIPGTVAPLEQRQQIAGCLFADRCDVKCPQAAEPVPLYDLPGSGNRRVRCHRRKAGEADG